MKNQGVRAQWRWAVTTGPDACPCLFNDRRSACENRDSDEYVVKALIVGGPSHRAKTERKVTAKQRERV